MFTEIFTCLTTPCPEYVRRMDYLSEAIGMRNRYQRNRAAWQPHLENTRRFVIAAADGCRKRSRAVILGAGLLLDVPIEELTAMFEEVVLMDIVFLPEVRRVVKRFGNAKIVRHDVTNMAQRLHENTLHGVRELPAATPGVPIDEDTGFVVSLNILSQLWVVPRAYALRRLKHIDEEELDGWCRQVVESHHAFLTSLSCSVCLVADHEFVKRDREGTIVGRASTVWGLTLPEPHASWTWNIAPMGERRPYLSKELNVGAWYVR